MKAVLLMSGGIDSPVAGYMMKRLGYELICVHLSQEPLTDDAAEIKSVLLSRKIGASKFYTFTYGQVLAEVARETKDRYFFIIQKRLMLRVAERAAVLEGAQGIITGDSLGQVGSQTLSNMANITKVTSMKILRPLLSFNKQEIIKVARAIDTYETSKGPEICNLLGPKHPATKSWEDMVLHEESKLDMERIVNSIMESKRETVL